jgi:hypothetical protein
MNYMPLSDALDGAFCRACAAVCAFIAVYDRQIVHDRYRLNRTGSGADSAAYTSRRTDTFDVGALPFRVAGDLYA